MMRQGETNAARSGRTVPQAILLLALFAAVLIAVCIAGQAFAAGFVGQIVKSQGDLRIARDGKDMPAGPSTALQLGDVVKTGAGGRVRMRFTDGSILSLGENSALSIDIYAVDATNKSRTVVLTLLQGVVNAAAAKSGENAFDYQIKTANGYSAVRGTKWIVADLQEPGAPKRMLLCVLNGQVELGANAGTGKPQLVAAGQWGSVDPSGNVTPPKPTTPELLQPLINATSDVAGGGVPSTVPPTTVPPVLPVTPVVPPVTVPNDRAFKSDKSSRGGQDKQTGGGGYGKAGN
jgi:hypothetical protein